MQTGLNINYLDCHKTLIDLFHPETHNFFTELKHSQKKKFISRGIERERVDFERESSVWVSLRFLDDKVILPFSFLQSQSYYSWSAKHYNSETCLATARIILEKGQHEL